MAERAHRDTLHAAPNGTAPPDASRETLASAIPTAQRVQRDTWVARPNGTASYARSRDVPVRSPPLGLALHSAVHRASCVSLPLRSAKRPLQANIHKSTDSLRLPRFRTDALIHSHTRTRFNAQGHEIQQFHLPCTIPRACHVKRTRSNVKMHASPHLPSESTAQRPPKCLRASGVPRLPRSRHAELKRPIATEATLPRRHEQHDPNKGPTLRPPDYKREPFATHSGKRLEMDRISSKSL